MIVVDAWLWMTEDGAVTSDGPVRAYMLRVAALIEAGGPLPVMHGRETVVPCRRRPRRKACPGLLVVVKTADDELHAFCPVCGSDEFLVSNWRGTPWAEGPMEPVPVEQRTQH